MPSLEVSSRHQKAVLWAASSHDDYGNPLVDAAAEITVRWVEKRTEGVGPNGEAIAIDATVVVDQEIAVGSIMWLGAKDDLPDTPTNLKQVVAYNQTPDIKGREFYRTVSLIRYSDTLPTLA